MNEYTPKSKEWFVDRIGQRVYRNHTGPCCARCEEISENGLIVQNELHADYLATVDAEFAAEGVFCHYSDKRHLNADHIGLWAVYRPTGEIGRIKSFDNEMQVAWIVFKADDELNTENYRDYTGQSTKYRDIIVKKHV